MYGLYAKVLEKGVERKPTPEEVEERRSDLLSNAKKAFCHGLDDNVCGFLCS
jgi:hypothetical protein